MSDSVNDYGLESGDGTLGDAGAERADSVNEYGLGAPDTQTGEAAQRVGTGVMGNTDDVNDYGLGAPNTQTGEAAGRASTGAVDEPGLVHGLGPSDGPYLGEAASEQEGVRYATDDDTSVTGDTVQPGAIPERRDPLDDDPLAHDEVFGDGEVGRRDVP